MKPGDIILTEFPKTNFSRGKLRPALVIALTPGRYEDALLAMISSKTHQFIVGFDVLIRENDPDFARTGLKSTSVIRLSRLATVEKRIIVAKLGEVDKNRLTVIYDRLINWMESLKKS